MGKTKYEVRFSSRFKRDLKKAKKQGRNLDKLFRVIEQLANGEKLEPEYRDHELGGDFIGTRECHIESDWLLIYELHVSMLVLVLYRNGSHADLFGK